MRPNPENSSTQRSSQKQDDCVLQQKVKFENNISHQSCSISGINWPVNHELSTLWLCGEQCRSPPLAWPFLFIKTEEQRGSEAASPLCWSSVHIQSQPGSGAWVGSRS